jgi:hypothetical protein
LVNTQSSEMTGIIYSNFLSSMEPKVVRFQ